MTNKKPEVRDMDELGLKVQQIFEEYLEKQGLRKTPERFTILHEIYAINEHFDMDSLYSHMKSKDFNISRATLYNTIEHLLACDLVTKRQFGKNIAQFERSFSFKQHDHLICTDCDKVLEFCDPRIQQIQSIMGQILDFTVTHHALNLYGKCNKLATMGACPNFNTKKQVNLDPTT